MIELRVCLASHSCNCFSLLFLNDLELKKYRNCCSLKEHNGELKGGAKASRAGRPWVCACIVCGFTNRSEGIYMTIFCVLFFFKHGTEQQIV